MKVYLGADHRGFELKNKLLEWPKSNGYETEDCGAYELTPNDDYVDYAKKVAEKVVSNEGSRGVVICGTGVGVDIMANRAKGIRCGLGLNNEQVKVARNDDNINVLALASDFVDGQTAQTLVETFLQTEFYPSENHQRRIEKIDQ